MLHRECGIASIRLVPERVEAEKQVSKRLAHPEGEPALEPMLIPVMQDAEALAECLEIGRLVVARVLTGRHASSGTRRRPTGSGCSWTRASGMARERSACPGARARRGKLDGLAGQRIEDQHSDASPRGC
jgi:hypothetical protein